MSTRPLVSVILTTRDRPALFALALLYYRAQVFSDSELIVVDDGHRHPVESRLLDDPRERLIRVPTGTPLGHKLNTGVAAARGVWCQKMDDDDFYAPTFLETMVAEVAERGRDVCRPGVGFLMPFLLFDVARWQIRHSGGNNVPGATLLFNRIDAIDRPFRGLMNNEDMWFFTDLMRMGAAMSPVFALETFVAVRHGRARSERGHTWERQSPRTTVEDDIAELNLHTKGPSELFPDWAIPTYHRLHLESRGSPA